VTVIDDNGCSVTNSFTVNIAGALGVNVSPSYSEVSEGETVQLTAAGGESYIWTPAIGLSCTDCPNPVATATQDIVYYVIATDDNGCTGSDSAVIVLKLPCGEIYVPTAFSPNGKGPDANNELCVYGTAVCVEEFLFQVYDRWGEKVFETTDITKCWDGKHKGKEMNSGIYVYRQYVKLTSGEEIDTSGNTTLVR
jgi:gliding motility-associated-like protein